MKLLQTHGPKSWIATRVEVVQPRRIDLRLDRRTFFEVNVHAVEELVLFDNLCQLRMVRLRVENEVDKRCDVLRVLIEESHAYSYVGVIGAAVTTLIEYAERRDVLKMSVSS